MQLKQYEVFIKDFIVIEEDFDDSVIENTTIFKSYNAN